MKRYFLTVSKYYNTTKLGKEIADYIYKKYNNSIVTDAQLVDIPDEIKLYMDNLIVSNPRLKPMTIRVYGLIGGKRDDRGLTTLADSVKVWIYSSLYADNDNRPFTLHAQRIHNDYSSSVVVLSTTTGADGKQKAKGGDK